MSARAARIKARLLTRGLIGDCRTLALEYGVELDEALGRCRSKAVVGCRHAIWRHIRQRYPLSYPEIGRLFEVDHSTVMSACKRRDDDEGRDEASSGYADCAREGRP